MLEHQTIVSLQQNAVCAWHTLDSVDFNHIETSVKHSVAKKRPALARNAYNRQEDAPIGWYNDTLLSEIATSSVDWQVVWVATIGLRLPLSVENAKTLFCAAPDGTLVSITN